MQPNRAPVAEPGSEPLPIWFFVGVILAVYGIIILLAGLFGTPRPTVLAETRPALWWSAVMIAFGLLFTLAGLWGRRRP